MSLGNTGGAWARRSIVGLGVSVASPATAPVKPLTDQSGALAATRKARWPNRQRLRLPVPAPPGLGPASPRAPPGSPLPRSRALAHALATPKEDSAASLGLAKRAPFAARPRRGVRKGTTQGRSPNPTRPAPSPSTPQSNGALGSKSLLRRGQRNQREKDRRVRGRVGGVTHCPDGLPSTGGPSGRRRKQRADLPTTVLGGGVHLPRPLPRARSPRDLDPTPAPPPPKLRPPGQCTPLLLLLYITVKPVGLPELD